MFTSNNFEFRCRVVHNIYVLGLTYIQVQVNNFILEVQYNYIDSIVKSHNLQDILIGFRDCYLLGCYAVQSARSTPKFQSNVMIPSSGNNIFSKIERQASNKLLE